VAKQQRFGSMPTYTAKRELLASRDAVWAFLAEPNRLADWWPGVRGVHPDRRGLAPGARWQVQTQGRPNPLVGPKLDVTGMIVVLEARRPELVAWQFVDGKVDVELRLAEVAPERTTAELTVSAPWLSGLRRKLPQRALTRLHALCQTGAEA
jgi:uncharacterized protein YndB with AHSA1/START domain